MGSEQFIRTALLLGEDGVKRLRCASVAVFGVGGVGSFAAEALARVMRRELKKRGISALRVVYSREEAKTPQNPAVEPAPGKRQTPGSVSFVPSAAGLILAGEVVRILTKAE